jgi:hypothetical protein
MTRLAVVLVSILLFAGALAVLCWVVWGMFWPAAVALTLVPVLGMMLRVTVDEGMVVAWLGPVSVDRIAVSSVDQVSAKSNVFEIRDGSQWHRFVAISSTPSSSSHASSFRAALSRRVPLQATWREAIGEVALGRGLVLNGGELPYDLPRQSPGLVALSVVVLGGLMLLSWGPLPAACGAGLAAIVAWYRSLDLQLLPDGGLAVRRWFGAWRRVAAAEVQVDCVDVDGVMVRILGGASLLLHDNRNPAWPVGQWLLARGGRVRLGGDLSSLLAASELDIDVERLFLPSGR